VFFDLVGGAEAVIVDIVPTTFSTFTNIHTKRILPTFSYKNLFSKSELSTRRKKSDDLHSMSFITMRSSGEPQNLSRTLVPIIKIICTVHPIVETTSWNAGNLVKVVELSLICSHEIDRTS
jgi:hypothetical protein